MRTCGNKEKAARHRHNNHMDPQDIRHDVAFRHMRLPGS
ncbi:hypothetical protein B5T_02153 [Alloalcanivorax dieselolei B5]|uniref:Uncharacterized protein n=2 Tax=Alloalcanivorax dieselolei TaxID=285091 RepID=K0CFD4_ALCDB|nr:hypothetical protein B5T_02153 [Alloalcanivorax dieselolei B5]